jgi:hypothetical protein
MHSGMHCWLEKTYKPGNSTELQNPASGEAQIRISGVPFAGGPSDGVKTPKCCVRSVNEAVIEQEPWLYRAAGVEGILACSQQTISLESGMHPRSW